MAGSDRLLKEAAGGEKMATDSAPTEPERRLADNSHNWPGLAAVLAPAAGGECQMLGLAIAEACGRPDRTAAEIPPVGKA